MSSAILLLAHGTPNRLSEMSGYLQHVTGGRSLPPHVIAELQHRYAQIGLQDEPLLAQAFAERLQPALTEARATYPSAPVLFTAHSVPCHTILSAPVDPGAPSSPTVLSSAKVGSVPAGGLQDYGPATTPDPYPIECKLTAAAVAKLLAPVGMTGRDWYFAFQSQGIAGAPWLGPTVEDTLKALAAEGHKAVVIQPIGFLCDHVEILYDIDINFRSVAEKLGMKLYRPESLNDSPTLIRALAHVLA
jgi:ferrochelatase